MRNAMLVAGNNSGCAADAYGEWSAVSAEDPHRRAHGVALARTYAGLSARTDIHAGALVPFGSGGPRGQRTTLPLIGPGFRCGYSTQIVGLDPCMGKAQDVIEAATHDREIT
jgi:hypothetical protein